jgi:hypothetical protein
VLYRMDRKTAGQSNYLIGRSPKFGFAHRSFLKLFF